MFSERGKELRIIDGHKIRFHKELNGGVRRWCCAVKWCTAYTKTNSVGDVIESKLVHEQDAYTDEELARDKFRNSVKRKALDDLCDRPSKLIHSELRAGRGTDPSTLDTSDFDSASFD